MATEIYVCRSTCRIAVIDYESESVTPDKFLTVSSFRLWPELPEADFFRTEIVTELQAYVSYPLQFLVSCGLGIDWDEMPSFEVALDVLTETASRYFDSPFRKAVG